jgi:hypothetical protein
MPTAGQCLMSFSAFHVARHNAERTKHSSKMSLAQQRTGEQPNAHERAIRHRPAALPLRSGAWRGLAQQRDVTHTELAVSAGARQNGVDATPAPASGPCKNV